MRHSKDKKRLTQAQEGGYLILSPQKLFNFIREEIRSDEFQEVLPNISTKLLKSKSSVGGTELRICNPENRTLLLK